MREKDYWTRRMEDMIVESEQSVLDFEIKLTRAYGVATISIRKEIEAFFQKYAKENKIPYAEARRRLVSSEMKDFKTLLQEWQEVAHEAGLSKEYSEYLKELGKKVYVSRLESLEASIRVEVEKLKANQYVWMTELVSLNYLAGYYSTYYTVSQGLEIGVNFATIDKLGIEKAIKTRWDGKNYSDAIWADKDKLIKSIETILPRSFSQGLNSNTLGDMLSKELGTSKNRGRALARTEINYLCNQAALDVYKASGLEEYEFLATLDMRTSEICRGMDGFIGKVSQAKVNVNYPPMHVNCRSTTIPHFKDQEVEERIARDEGGRNIKVPRRMSQEEWIKAYAPEDQQEKLLKFKKAYENKQ